MPYTMKFMVMVVAPFLARVNPVSTIAKPACMNITRNPATSVQTKLIATVLAAAAVFAACANESAACAARVTGVAAITSKPSPTARLIRSPERGVERLQQCLPFRAKHAQSVPQYATTHSGRHAPVYNERCRKCTIHVTAVQQVWVLAVALERLRQEPEVERLVAEHVGQTHLVAHALDPRLHQLELLGLTQAQRVEPLGLGLAHVAWRRLGVGVGVFVMGAQRVPMLIPGTLDRVPDSVARERHGIATGRAPPGCPALAPCG